MKKLVLFFVMLAGLLGANAQFSRARLQATGLTCAMCSNAINKALQKLPFIDKVNSDIKNSAFDIAFKNDHEVDIDAMRSAVEDAGFFVGGLQVTGQFADLKIGEENKVRLGRNDLRFLHTTKQILNGEQTIRVLNKEYLTVKEFRKMDPATRSRIERVDKEGKEKILYVTI